MFSIVTMLSQCAADPEFDEAEWNARVKAADSSLLYAPHVNEKGNFFNPWMERVAPSPFSAALSRIFGEKTQFDNFPEERYGWRENDYAYLQDKDFGSISFAGHASMIIKMDGETVFTDPFFSNAAFLAGKDIKIKFDYSKVPRRPVVLISHNHYDHLDTKTIKELIKKDAVFVVPLKLKDFFIKLKAAEVYELDWWESVVIGPVTYTLLPAQHWSLRLGQGNDKTLWGSYLIQGSKSIYFSGDTGYFRGFEEFGNRYAINYAILGVGAYEPRWFMHYQHMNVAEFIAAADELKAKKVIPMHFGVISLSDEPLVYPLYELDEFLKKNPHYAERFELLRVGEYLVID
jgi:L-ascorbate metabolism protein UlaG (beta-lactamase superfamily)